MALKENLLSYTQSKRKADSLGYSGFQNALHDVTHDHEKHDEKVPDNVIPVEKDEINEQTVSNVKLTHRQFSQDNNVEQDHQRKMKILGPSHRNVS